MKGFMHISHFKLDLFYSKQPSCKEYETSCWGCNNIVTVNVGYGARNTINTMLTKQPHSSK